MNHLIRYISGYMVGIFIFVLLIPYGLYELATIDPIIHADLTTCLAVRIIISLPFSIFGLLFMIWSNISLFITGKGGPADGFNVAISPRTKKLVINGPYRYSRNPMVFGAFSLYFSIGLFLFSIICLIVLMIFLGFAVYYLRIIEEKRLLKDFGNEYADYRSKVPMIFPKKLIIKQKVAANNN